MTLLANSQGVVQGKFTIPADVPTGTKKVVFTGAGGSFAEASFVGRGILETQFWQQIQRSVAQQVVQNPAAGISRVDPLAQTFSLPTRSQIGAIDLYVTAKGTTPIVVQIREVDLGVPTKTILAETQLFPTSITLNAWNRFTFPNLVTVQPDVEYAIVVLCNDAVGAVAIAEMGKQDLGGSHAWVTSQPYQVGVLLSSSNASTWTAHQDRDLTFRILTAKYTESVREIDLGVVSVTDATDILVMGVTDQPASGSSAEIELTFPDSTVRSAADGQVIQLTSAVTGDIAVKARLRATDKESALLAPGTQIVPGEVQTSADYITRAFEADAGGADITVIFDAKLPGSSSVAVYVKGDDISDTWTAVSFDSSKALGGGKSEMKYVITGVTEDVVRVKLVLTGSIASRPEVENLRISVT